MYRFCAHSRWASKDRRRWPTGITEKVCEDAGLPPSQRVVPGIACPLAAPVWGCIMDDVWAIVTDEDKDDCRRAEDWLPAVERQWEAIGVTSHAKKRVDLAEGDEIQGAWLHPNRHTMGLSSLEMLCLMKGTLMVATCWRPARQCLSELSERSDTRIASGLVSVRSSLPPIAVYSAPEKPRTRE